MIKAHQWKDYFPMLNKSNFASPDEEDSEKFMEFNFLRSLNQLSLSAERQLVITSGYRTPKYNAKIGGVPHSPHLQGIAADINIKDSYERYLLLYWAMRLGFRRIGIYKNHIHLDADIEKPQSVIWYK